jgi:hypothetical protein
VSAVRRHPIITFFVLTYALTFWGVCLIRRGRLAHSLLHGRASDRRPHRDTPHPGASRGCASSACG